MNRVQSILRLSPLVPMMEEVKRKQGARNGMNDAKYNLSLVSCYIRKPVKQ